MQSVVCGQCGKVVEMIQEHKRVSDSSFARYDQAGIYEMIACDDCYENNYPYKKFNNLNDYQDEMHKCGETIETEDY